MPRFKGDVLTRVFPVLALVAAMLMVVAVTASAETRILRYQGQPIPVEGHGSAELRNRFINVFSELHNDLEFGDYNVALTRFNRAYLTTIAPIVGANNRSQLAYALHVDRTALPLGGVQVDLRRVLFDDDFVEAELELRPDRDAEPVIAILLFDGAGRHFVGQPADPDSEDLT